MTQSDLPDWYVRYRRRIGSFGMILIIFCTILHLRLTLLMQQLRRKL